MKFKFTREKRKHLLTALVLCVILFFVLVPLWWAIMLSFDGKAVTDLPKFSWMPAEFTMKNYQYAFKLIDLTRYYANTIFITIVNTFVSVFFALVAGYAFAKGQFVGKKFWYYFMLAVMMIPFESRMIPLYQQYSSWGMINTYWPLILGNVAYVYGIFFARQNIAALPDVLRESAKLDGCGEWKIFFRIIVPLCKPVIAALSILQMIAQWNSYLWPLVVIRSTEKQVLSVGVALFNAKENAVYYGPRFAVAVLGAIPLIIVFLFFQKYIVQSVALSGIKE